MKRTILTTAAFAAVILLCSTANAADTTWRDVSSVWNGDWNDPAHWTSGVPTSSMTAELPTSSGGGAYTVAMDMGTGACKTLTTHLDATLQIESGNELRIGNTGGTSSTINGTIQLLPSSSVLTFMNSHTVSGTGSIEGQDNSALIQITTSETLTSSTTIEGNCQIVPVGGASTTFINNGTVHANVAGILEIRPDLIGDSSGSWQVSTSASAVLTINATSNSVTHDGNVTVSNGTLNIDYSFSTTGDLSFTGGTIDAIGTTFSFNQPS